MRQSEKHLSISLLRQLLGKGIGKDELGTGESVVLRRCFGDHDGRECRVEKLLLKIVSWTLQYLGLTKITQR